MEERFCAPHYRRKPTYRRLLTLALCLGLSLFAIFGASPYQLADAWQVPGLSKFKKNGAASKAQPDAKPTIMKASRAKAARAKASRVKPSKETPKDARKSKPEKKASNPKPAAESKTVANNTPPIGSLNNPPAAAEANKPLDKAEIASATAPVTALMAIESKAAAKDSLTNAQITAQSISRQFFFRDAFLARSAPATTDQVLPIYQYIQQSNKKVNGQDARTFAEAILYFCHFYQVNPKLVASMIAVESSYRTDAVSTSGAIGLGQLKPDTANWLAVADPYDPIENIGGMTRYLSWLIRKYNGSYDHAVSAYYQGPGTVDRNGITEACLPYLYKVNNALAKF